MDQRGGGGSERVGHVLKRDARGVGVGLNESVTYSQETPHKGLRLLILQSNVTVYRADEVPGHPCAL